MKYCFIVNPLAGKGKMVEGVLSDISAACEGAGVDHSVLVSRNIEETRDFISENAAAVDGEVSFIACGGDGTLCQTILLVMELSAEQREKVSVGVVPMGTGNDFVSNFTDKERFFNIEAQIKGSAYEIDLVKCNDLYSVNMVNVGFDSHVVCKKERLSKKKWLPRKLAYIAGLVITLIRKPGLKVDFSRDGDKPEKRDLLLTTLANGAFCGGGFNSNPKASLTDGNIDCIAVKNVSRLKFLSLVGKYKNGTHLSGKFDSIISHFKCRKADLVFSEETPVSVDGELVYTKELHLSVDEKAIKIRLPDGVLPKVREIKERLDEGVEKIEEKIATAVGARKVKA
ncbi:MAG: hypothetical protein IKA68_03070 [Clostridia bacterium]|nr:hypothetical protein [Clostridia bacterium]